DANPLYTAPEAELSTARIALFKSTAGLKPLIVPSSVANRKTAPPESPISETTNVSVLSKTVPVGADPLPPAGGGITTPFCRNGAADPSGSYSVLRPVPLSAIENGLVGPKEMPHGCTSLGSVCAASPDMSETRWVGE